MKFPSALAETGWPSPALLLPDQICIPFFRALYVKNLNLVIEQLLEADVMNGFWYVQGSAKRPFPGLVNFVPAVAYHFCLNLPAAFSQPGNGLLADPFKNFFLQPRQPQAIT